LTNVHGCRRYISFQATNKAVYIATLMGYFFSISLLFLMPVDVAVVLLLSPPHPLTLPS